MVLLWLTFSFSLSFNRLVWPCYHLPGLLHICITLTFFHLLQQEQVMDTSKLFIEPGNKPSTATSALLLDFWFLKSRNLCRDLNNTSQRRADELTGALGFWVCRPVSPEDAHLHPILFLDSAKVNSCLQPHSQSSSSQEMLCCLRKRVNIFSLLLIIGWLLEKPHQIHTCCQQRPDADLLLPYQQASAQAWPNWVSCRPSSPGLVRGGDGAVGVLTGTESVKHLLVNCRFLPGTAHRLAERLHCLWCCRAPHAQLSQICLLLPLLHFNK